MKALLVFALFMALVTTNLSAADESLLVDNNDDRSRVGPPSRSRFLARKHRGAMTCNEYPRVCGVVGSPGPDCCKRRCVNVEKDRLNCGKCGRKCKHTEICCNGNCVNPMSDKWHCGGCNNGCDKGSKCLFGMCSYA
ncbi:F-box/RNI/FBD-like domains-containing protein [Hibiscus syriacus]|uniref:F-box/RNI/FBD-like domains-containing protein n=1 Tax=Hibiscus syriacus TaxID=106335 RepID=A0A6A3A7V1_HIBSY|nr:stigma-specific STIG1-like protein 1 [Hibiscus syriacus]KAE8700454.1 F-box/RNI/FBD-like domains-containing protein [Hibiscus syriacus]